MRPGPLCLCFEGTERRLGASDSIDDLVRALRPKQAADVRVDPAEDVDLSELTMPSDPFEVLTAETRLPAERPPVQRIEVPPEVAAAAEISETLRLGYHLGSAVERIVGAGDDGSDAIPRLREAVWLIERYMGLLEARPLGADIDAVTARLARNGDYIHALGALGSALSAQPREPALVPPGVPVSDALGGRAGEAEEEAREPSPDAVAADRYPLGRELLGAGLRIVVFVVAIAAIVLVATIASEWF